VIEDLDSLNRSTEADFLAVGRELDSCIRAAGTIRAAIGEFSESLAGEAGEQAAAALHVLLERAAEMQRRVECAADAIGGLGRSAGSIRRSFAGMAGVALAFQVSATVGRVETARLGRVGDGLANLGDEVRASAAAIRQQVQGAAEAAAALDERISAAAGRISELASEELRELPELIRTVEESLETLQGRRERARHSSLGLQDRFTALSESAGRIVVALQFHDITRQRIEHVVDALRELIREGGPSPSARDLAVAQLQRQQLAAAASTFSASARQIREELAGMAETGRGIEQEARTLLGLATDERGAFWGRMERCFARVLEAVFRCGRLKSEANSAREELRRSVSQLAAGVGEIQAIGQGIHYLAINTAIQSVHLGGAGEPLSVVAASMQQLQAEAAQTSEEAAAALSAMGRAIDAAGAVDEGNGDVLVTELQNGIAGLQESSERSASWTEQVGSAAVTLSVDVDHAVSKFDVGERFAEVAERCGAELEAVGGMAAAPGAPARAVDELAVRYTMRAEHDVHARAVSGEAASPVATLDDNVELF
jgi:hypothetical protein